jgi:chromosome segregation ATPase
MRYRTDDLTRLLHDEEATKRGQGEELDRRLARIAVLKARIVELQGELALEEAKLAPLERSIMLSNQRSMKVEDQLSACIEELDGMTAMKQALHEEKEGVARKLDHRQSELLSLRAIQKLALGDDYLE